MVIIGNKNIKEFVGKVVSAKCTKTLTVEVARIKKHPIYKKRYQVKKKYYVHDEKSEANKGDQVKIREYRPMSKLKRWILIEVLKKSEI